MQDRAALFERSTPRLSLALVQAAGPHGSIRVFYIRKTRVERDLDCSQVKYWWISNYLSKRSDIG